MAEHLMPADEEERRQVLEELERAEASKGFREDEQEIMGILASASAELRRDRDLVLAAATKSIAGAAGGMAAELGADREFVLQLLERAKGERGVLAILNKTTDELQRDRDLMLAAATKSIAGTADGMAAELGADREFVLQLLEWATCKQDVECVLRAVAQRLRHDEELVSLAKRKVLQLFEQATVSEEIDGILREVERQRVLAALERAEDERDVMAILEKASDELLQDEELAKCYYGTIQVILKNTSDELRRDRDLVLAAAAKSAKAAMDGLAAELGSDLEFVLQLLELAKYDWEVEAILEYASDELRRDRDLVLVAAAKSVKGATKCVAAELWTDREFVLQLLERATGSDGVQTILEKVVDELWQEEEFVATVCGTVLALLCTPEDEHQAVGAVFATCATVHAVPEPVLQRLVELLSSGADKAQQNAAKALAPAMENELAKLQVLQTVQESADAKDLLAVLAYSSTSGDNEELAEQARMLLESADPGAKDKNRQKEMASSGLAVLFSRHKQQGWTEPDPTAEWGETRPDGQRFTPENSMARVETRVFVEGHGQGKVNSFKKTKVPGMNSTHLIFFDVGGEKEIKLRRKGNGQTRWLLAPKGMSSDGKTDEIVWQARGGRRLDPQRPRDARVDDVCLWMHEQGGMLQFYAGLFGWVRLKPDQAGIDGDQLLRLTDETLREKLCIQMEVHREALLSAIAPLRGFLGRYRLGRFLHRSASCIVLVALDELNDDQEVLLKLMRHRNQFESEITRRFSNGKPLDAAYIIGIRCWHTPSAEPFVDEAGKAQEAESTDSAPTDMAMYKYVLNTHVAKHDLANDIMHGHYAGRDKARVQRLLRKIVLCLWYCEQQNFGHGDVKCVH